jgi:hemerythrin-like domain-containing protein
MASLSPAFRADSQLIHHEHAAILEELFVLERSLERVAFNSESLADPPAAEQVRRIGQRLAEQLPEHCRREEDNLHRTVADVSVELCNFCRQMREEHQILLAELELFRQSLNELGRSVDREAALAHLKEYGKKLAHDMRRHIEVEERELSGFL